MGTRTRHCVGEMQIISKTQERNEDGILCNLTILQDEYGNTARVWDPVRTPEQQAAFDKRVRDGVAAYGRAIYNKMGEEAFLRLFPQEKRI